jgi:hypothetical protein
MVVLDCNFVRITVGKPERDPPALIHCHCLPASAITRQRMKPDGLQDSKRIERSRSIDGVKKQEGTLVVETAESSSSVILEQSTSPTVRERADHEQYGSTQRVIRQAYQRCA